MNRGLQTEILNAAMKAGKGDRIEPNPEIGTDEQRRAIERTYGAGARFTTMAPTILTARPPANDAGDHPSLRRVAECRETTGREPRVGVYDPEYGRSATVEIPIPDLAVPPCASAVVNQRQYGHLWEDGKELEVVKAMLVLSYYHQSQRGFLRQYISPIDIHSRYNILPQMENSAHSKDA
jgi:hypothetical protein